MRNGSRRPGQFPDIRPGLFIIRDDEFVDTIIDDTFNPEHDFSRSQSKHLLYLALYNHLQPREREILEMRYSLAGYSNQPKKMTLKEIGSHYGVTRECIRQTELRALRKLRSVNLLEQIMD